MRFTILLAIPLALLSLSLSLPALASSESEEGSSTIASDTSEASDTTTLTEPSPRPKAKIPGDTTGISQTVLDRVRSVEEMPLTAKPYQRLKIGGDVWMRWRGDHKFVLNPAREQVMARAKLITDSLAALPDDHIVKIVIPLDDSAQVRAAAAIVDSVPPPTRYQWHILEVPNATMKELDEAGLKPEYWEIKPIKPTDPFLEEIWRQKRDSARQQ